MRILIKDKDETLRAIQISDAFYEDNEVVFVDVWGYEYVIKMNKDDAQKMIADLFYINSLVLTEHDVLEIEN